MADAEVIKSFLVDLGFRINEADNRRWNGWLKDATQNVLGYAAAFKATALAVQAGVVAMSSRLEELHNASERTKASAENIRAVAFAVGQLGGSAEAARGSIEALASFLRSSPGAGALVRSLGVATSQNGKLRDTAEIMGDLGTKFRQMPFYQAKAFAGAMGIDETTLMAMIKGLGEFSTRYKDILRSMRVDLPSATANAHKLMQEFRETGVTFDALGTKIVGTVAPRIAQALRSLRLWMISNSGGITKAVEWIINVILGIGEAISRAAYRVGQGVTAIMRWLHQLSPEGKKTAEMVALLAGAIVLLNSSFLASPVGRILALASAIFLLWEDYQTWKEGGDSLIDWAKWEPTIQGAIEGLKAIGRQLNSLAEAVGGWDNVLQALLVVVAGRWALGMIAAFTRVGAAGATALLAPFTRLPVALLRLFGLGALGTLGVIAGGAAALLMPGGAGETPEHTAQQPGGATLQENLNRSGPAGGASGQAARGQQAMDYFMRQGWTREQAAGIVAQVEKESAFDEGAFNPAGGGQGAQGILQWRGARIDRFRRMFGRDPRGAPFEMQLAYIQWELTNPESDERRNGAALAGTRTAGEAGSTLSRGYVRPGLTEEERSREAAVRARAAGYWATVPAPPAPAATAATPGAASPTATPPAEETGAERWRRDLAANWRARLLGQSPAPGTGGSAGGGGVTINQENNIRVQGSGDPRENGRQVQGALSRANADLVRNTRGAIQ